MEEIINRRKWSWVGHTLVNLRTGNGKGVIEEVGPRVRRIVVDEARSLQKRGVE